jgi:hypothetical protein
MVPAFAKVNCREAEDANGQRVVVLENDFLKIEVMPQRGGRVSSFLNKQTGVQIVYWRHDKKFGDGGMIDEHDLFSETPFTYKILKSDNVVRLTLTSNTKPINIQKTCVLQSNRPTLTVEYVVENHGQEVCSRFQHRNFIRPGGVSVSKDDVYFTPISFAGVVRSERYVQASEAPEAWDGGILAKLGAPWHAFLNTKKQTGIAFYSRNDIVRGLYYWQDSAEYPTLEWFNKPLAPGQQYRYTVDMIAVSGFSGLTGASRHYLLDTKIHDNGSTVSINWQYMPVDEEGVNAELVLSLIDADTGLAVAKDKKLITAKHVVEKIQGEFTSSVDPNKNLLLFGQVFIGGKSVGQTKVQIKRKLPFKPFELMQPYESSVQKHPIPHWRQAVKQLTVRPTSLERERGFVVFQTVKDRVPQSSQIMSVDIGIGEFESLPLHVYPLKGVGKISIEPAAGPLNVQVRMQVDQEKEQKDWKHTILMRKLVPDHSFVSEKESSRTAWLTIDSRGLEPGEYSEKVTVTAEGGGRLEVTVNAKIWPVQLPKKRFFSGEAEHLVNGLCPAIEGNKGWNIETGRKYVRDLVEHRVNFGQLAAPWRASNPDFIEIKIRDTDEGLVAAIKENPKRFQQGKLPLLNFSYWNPLIYLMIDEGMTRINIIDAYVPSYFSDFIEISQLIYGPKVAPESPEHNRIRSWFWREISAYISDMGFFRRYVKIDDETPEDKFPMWVRAGTELKDAGFRVLVTTSNHIIDERHAASTINPALDLWQIGSVDPRNIGKRLSEGNIDSQDELWSYTGSGTVWRTYEDMRTACGIGNVYAGLSGFHIHEYLRWNLDACIIFPTPDGPIGSPAWEGARDGYEDAEYYSYVRYLINQLGDRQRAAEFNSKLKKIAGESNDAVLRFGYQTLGTMGECIACLNGTVENFVRAKRMLLEMLTELQRQVKVVPKLHFAEQEITDYRFVAGDAVPSQLVRDLEVFINYNFRLKVKVVKEKDLTVVDKQKGKFVLLGGPSSGLWAKELNSRMKSPLFTTNYPAKGWYLVKDLPISETGGARILWIAGADAEGDRKAIKTLENFLE